MNIFKYLVLGCTLTLVPSLASADRYFGGRQNFSKPCNNGWNNYRPNNYRNNNFFGFSNGDSRIRNGIQSGQLSRSELTELRGREQELRQDQRAAWSDGYLSKNERKDLQNDYKNFDKFLNHNLNDGERANYPFQRRW